MSTDPGESTFESVAWFNAITLPERAAMLGKSASTAAGIDPERGSKLLARWRSQLPFAAGSYFEERLEQDRLTEDEFARLLGERPESLRARCSEKPAWLVELEKLFTARFSAAASDSRQPASPGSSLLVDNARERLCAGVQSLAERYSVVPFNPSTVDEMFLPYLLQQVGRLTNRTMVLELNVARLQGLLEGETAEERYRSFGERLQRPEFLLSVLEEYPVLARQLLLRIDQWVSFSLEFLNNLCEDWSEIKQTFCDDTEPGELSAVSIGAGDTHRNGRSVAIASFSSGFGLVYKPRSLSVDVHYAKLLAWLNEKGDHPAFRILRTIDRKTHGWSEFVAVDTCASSSEIERFYQRLGGCLALLYALEATDFHLENLIAAGEHPVLIDLEALFHPRIQEDVSASLPAADVMGHSVLRVGLLPQRMWLGVEPEGVDLSGVGGAAGQLTPFEIPALEGVGTDEMRIARKRLPIPGSQNRPTLNGGEVKADMFVESVVSGFTSVYRTILKNRDEFLAQKGPIAAFADDEVRVVLRPTRSYGVLLNESYHPDVLRNALDRDWLFDRLWAEVEYRPYLARLIAAEQADLRAGDIPVFYTHPASRSLWTSAGEQVNDLFDEPSFDTVQRRVAAFSENDLERQSWFIRASMTSLSAGMGHEKWRGYKPAGETRDAGRDDLLTAAREIGDRLDVLAIRNVDLVSWIGVVMINERSWSLLPLGEDLYGGTLGIALFLAYLGALTKEDRYTELARSALAITRRQIKSESYQNQRATIGGFSGKGGVIYVLSQLGSLWNEPELIDEAEEVTRTLAPLVEQDRVLDVVGGAAGCIGGLASLNAVRPSRAAVVAAKLCAERLLEAAISCDGGTAWPGVIEVAKPLTGFSHGAAGMAWALLNAASMTGDYRFRDAALSAMTYERAVFRESDQNWPDFRIDRNSESKSAAPGSVIAWCHGAPGIGLGRLASLSQCHDPMMRTEIDTALDVTMKRGFGLNHSLCHGDLGNADLLVEASIKLKSDILRERVRSLGGIILESIKSNGWLCGVPMGVETPGLMTGLAGIGYGLLRLADPETVPSVLSLAPPTSRDLRPQAARVVDEKSRSEERPR